jgi:Asp-tRNA(Asn)/Glu-tRNA(Gln) amidotransferase C subunit
MHQYYSGLQQIQYVVPFQHHVDAYVKTLSKTSKKRDLTKEETKMLKEFSKVLTRIEKVVNLKIKNIEEKDL